MARANPAVDLMTEIHAMTRRALLTPRIREAIDSSAADLRNVYEDGDLPFVPPFSEITLALLRELRDEVVTIPSLDVPQPAEAVVLALHRPNKKVSTRG